MQPIAEEKGLEVGCSSERSSRIGHPVALSRILLNLTTNALKFTDEGLVEVTCTEVSELGRGVFGARHRARHSPQAMGMLFEPFRRRQKDRDYAFSGSGLGLDLPQAGRGDGRVPSGGDRPGQGTRFYFTLDLPLAAQPEPS